MYVLGRWKLLKFWVFLLPLIILSHNFYILESMDLTGNTKMDFAKLKSTPQSMSCILCPCLDPSFLTFSLEQGNHLDVHSFTILSGWSVTLQRLSSYSKSKCKGDMWEVKFFFFFSLLFGCSTNTISRLLCSASDLTGYSLVFSVKCEWWYWDQTLLLISWLCACAVSSFVGSEWFSVTLGSC